jgi:septum formation protein
MNNESLPVNLILASTSKYREMLMQRLRTPFVCRAPDIDESRLANESAHDMVRRLAMLKAAVISEKHPESLVIGSDQVAVFDSRVIGKPGGYPAAFDQLRSFSGQTVEFLTAVAVKCRQSGFSEQHTDRTLVTFRRLEDAEIDRYLQMEKPYNCAGSFKAESVGIALFENIKSEDPTALIGLPLIRLAALLRQAGLQLP